MHIEEEWMFATGSLARWTALLAALVLPAAVPAQAPADYPNKAIRLITPFAAGATTDVLSRIISEKMVEHWGQPVVVENRPGAAGMTGTEVAARSAPDGYTIVNVISSHVVHRQLFKSVPFDALKDFEPVILLARTPLTLVVHPSVPAHNTQEFIAYAREKKGIGYGTSGVGSAVHLTTELFKQAANVDLQHVPYKGGAPALQDLLGGHITVVMSGLFTVSKAIAAGQVRPLFVTSAKRHPNFPDIPTLQESGFPGLVADEWWAILAPAGTPKPIVNKLNAEIARIFALPDVQDRIRKLGIEYIGSTPEGLRDFMRNESAKWEKVIRSAGIQPE
jgi:tripartite-type tricarboxylate transporter receptor subunit TctC